MRTRSENNRKLLKLAVFLIVVFIATLFLFIGTNVIFAQGPDIGIEYAEDLNLPSSPEKDIRILIADIVKYFLTFLGIIAVVMIMYAGWLWMTSEGSEEKISRAKRTLINAVIGLIIVLASYAIVLFIVNTISDGLTGTGGGGGGGTSGGGFGASGNLAIEYHYPARNQTNVPRNTKIVITFREPITVSDIITGTSINTSNVQITKTSEIDDDPLPVLNNFTAVASDDQKTFRFTQIPPYIGSPSEDIWYTVALTNAIRKGNGDLLFPGAGGGYDWKFEVGTFIDTNPPIVTSIVPQPDATEPRNVVIQVNFNEAIDPTSIYDSSNIEVRGNGSLLVGVLYVSNQYKTVEFLTIDDCGVNTCGGVVYCLPANSAISVLVKASTFDPIPFSYDGLVDMADNSLDGNKNGTAEGPQSQSGMPPYNENSPDPNTQGDDYTWLFNTSSQIDVSAPVIEEINPVISGTNVALDEAVYAVFNKRMMSSSLNKNSVPLYAAPAGSAVFYWITNETSLLEPIRTRLNINHADFAEEADYTPEINSGAKDIYQNCFNPSAGPSCTSDPAGGFPYCCNGSLSASNCAP